MDTSFMREAIHELRWAGVHLAACLDNLLHAAESARGLAWIAAVPGRFELCQWAFGRLAFERESEAGHD